jgi:hypothetical protein
VIVDILYEMRRGWNDATAGEKAHAVWALVNDVVALALVLLTLFLFLASTGRGFPTDAWLGTIVLAVVWLGSIVTVDPVVDRLVYAD